MSEIRIMTAEDYAGVYDLWINTAGMGLNGTDDSRDGIEKSGDLVCGMIWCTGIKIFTIW